MGSSASTISKTLYDQYQKKYYGLEKMLADENEEKLRQQMRICQLDVLLLHKSEICSKLEIDIDDLRVSLQNITLERNSAIAESNTHNKRIKDMDAQINTMMQQTTIVQKKNMELQKALYLSKSELGNARSKINRLTDKIRKKELMINEEKTRTSNNGNIQEEMLTLKTTLAESESKYEKQTRKLNSTTAMLNNERKQHKEALQSQKAKANKLRTEHTQVSSELSMLKKYRVVEVYQLLTELIKRANFTTKKLTTLVNTNRRDKYQKAVLEKKDINESKKRDLAVSLTIQFHENLENELKIVRQQNDCTFKQALKQVRTVSTECYELFKQFKISYPDSCAMSHEKLSKELNKIEIESFESIEKCFEKEVTIQTEILKKLDQERNILETISQVEKGNFGESKTQ